MQNLAEIGQHGWVYEVMEVNGDSGWAHCGWWAKALPSDAHERLTTFVLTTDSRMALVAQDGGIRFLLVHKLLLCWVLHLCVRLSWPNFFFFEGF